MFRTMTVRQKYSSKEYKEIENTLRIKLFQLQQECAKYKVSVLITIAGEDGSGRGEVINTLSSWLDTKKIRNHVFWKKTDDEAMRPEAWRYWINLPAYGEFGIFLGGWYGEPVRKAVYGLMSEEELHQIISRRLEFERTLADNNYVIAKFWLHIDEDIHKKRHQELRKIKGEYHFTPYEQDLEKHYPKLVDTMSKVITATDKDFAPWYVIDAYDREFRNASVARALINTIEHQLALKKQAQEKQKKVVQPVTPCDTCVSILDRVDLSKNLEKQDYQAQLTVLQNEVFQLSYKAYTQGISSTLVFEGWDAGGKGGAIRRLTAAIDSRVTRVIPISSPTDEELAHHYLWRFWRQVPMDGYVTIYDRSWYGRVLVERVEGFATPEEWKRAYTEINTFEEQLVADKNILLKFWMHISPEEQLRRFKEREEVPWKNYKITKEDWRNREQAPAYTIAADEMFMRTDTDYAPWFIIPAESKYVARIEILKKYRDALRKALDIKSVSNKKDKQNKELDLKSVAETLAEQKDEKETSREEKDEKKQKKINKNKKK